jgi:hypothetical protein
VNLIKPLRQFAALGIALTVTAFAHGQVIPIDDFDDMNPKLPGWTLADLSAGQPWGPGDYDPSSGALRISYEEGQFAPPGTPFNQSAMFAIWNDSSDPLYSNGFLRAKIRTDEPNANASVEMRLELATGTAYVLSGATATPTSNPDRDGYLLLSKFVGGEQTQLWLSDVDYLQGEDWNVELGTVGNRISAKVWKVDDPEPTMPQYDEIDPDPIMSGQFSISSDIVAGLPVPVDARADSTLDDIVFIVPEPASVLLILTGLIALLTLRR